ncbi:Pentatricopeptide repeat-containing protein, chloroplastic [Vitis vinifera]|uniref:Pentatricopeptide repeat-containing protein, chloroplastic n=1 Tax=Vitis vinifera TaxID=29760 RepID=A0A438H6T9_VITVI|nr:Pentatricopeptide repeat-containing protein, chloroplastic [Vitis vinifera]
MESNYGISPGPEHYACMVDLLSRAGFLKEAHKLIKEMPFEPTCIFWRTLLNGCRIWGDLELGFYAANRILELDPYNSSACLMVIDIYASAGRWKEVLEMRRQMRKREARKELGCSWIEIKGRIHLFTTRDDTHPEADHIYLTFCCYHVIMPTMPILSEIKCIDQISLCNWPLFLFGLQVVSQITDAIPIKPFRGHRKLETFGPQLLALCEYTFGSMLTAKKQGTKKGELVTSVRRILIVESSGGESYKVLDL